MTHAPNTPKPEPTSKQFVANGCSRYERGEQFLSVCPAKAVIGATVTVTGAHCPGDRADTAFISFVGDVDTGNEGEDADPPLGRISTASDTSFRLTYRIPSRYEPYVGRGGGRVRPGNYWFYGKPPECVVPFEVIADE